MTEQDLLHRAATCYRRAGHLDDPSLPAKLRRVLSSKNSVRYSPLLAQPSWGSGHR